MASPVFSMPNKKVGGVTPKAVIFVLKEPVMTPFSMESGVTTYRDHPLQGTVFFLCNQREGDGAFPVGL